MTREGAGGTAPAPSSRPRRAVDVKDWVGGVRLSAFTGIMLGLVVLAAFVLVPSVGIYLDQRQQVAALERSVQLTQDEIDELEAERERLGDPAYIVAQARERFYYVKPGEVVYLIEDDLPDSAIPPDQTSVSSDVEETRNDWMSQLLRSVAKAGAAKTAAPGGDER